MRKSVKSVKQIIYINFELKEMFDYFSQDFFRELDFGHL